MWYYAFSGKEETFGYVANVSINIKRTPDNDVNIDAMNIHVNEMDTSDDVPVWLNVNWK